MMKSTVDFLVTLLAVGLTSWTANARPLDPIPTSERTTRLSQMNYTHWDGQSDLRQVDYDLGCLKTQEILTIKDPASGATWQQLLVEMRPVVDNKVPVVLIVPTIEGTGLLEENAQSSLCSAGIASIIADVVDTALPTTFPAWGQEDKVDRNAILALRTTIDYAQASQYYDAKKVGVIGLSLGGIITAMLAGVEPDRLQAVVTVVGGGNMPNVLTNSVHSLVTELRQKRMAAMNWTDPNLYENQLRTTIKFDPWYFAPAAKRDRIYMIMAGADDRVPSVDQAEQWNAFGKPKGDTYTDLGHVDTLITVVFFQFGMVTDFFNSKFSSTGALAKMYQVFPWPWDWSTVGT